MCTLSHDFCTRERHSSSQLWNNGLGSAKLSIVTCYLSMKKIYKVCGEKTQVPFVCIVIQPGYSESPENSKMRSAIVHWVFTSTSEEYFRGIHADNMKSINRGLGVSSFLENESLENVGSNLNTFFFSGKAKVLFTCFVVNPFVMQFKVN